MLPDPAALAFFMAATITLNLTPGPDMLYVIANGVGRGRKAGVVSALGIGGGTVVHTAAAALGLSALLASSAIAYEVVRFAGAAYLIYLGIQIFRKGDVAIHSSCAAEGTMADVFRHGMITNILNPKVALFFLAFLPQFVDPSRGTSMWQFIFLGTLFNVSGTTVNAAVGTISGTAGGWIFNNPSAARIQKWFSGSVFLVLGARLALVSR